MLVVRLGVLHHQVLHAGRDIVWIALASFDRSSFRELHKTCYGGLWRQYRPILDDATVLQDASTALEMINRLINYPLLFKLKNWFLFSYDDDIFANVNVGAHRSGRNNCILSDEHMITDVQGKEGDAGRGTRD